MQVLWCKCKCFDANASVLMQIQVSWIKRNPNGSIQIQMFWFPKCKCFDANANVLDSKNTNANVAFSNAFAFEPKSDIAR